MVKNNNGTQSAKRKPEDLLSSGLSNLRANTDYVNESPPRLIDYPLYNSSPSNSLAEELLLQRSFFIEKMSLGLALFQKDLYEGALAEFKSLS